MTLIKRLRLGISAFACTAAIATGAVSAPAALSSTDARAYAAAFAAADRGDFIDSQMASMEVKDKSLLGYLKFSELMHPTAHRAAFSELAGWLARFRDLPVADRIFALASRRNPSEAPNLPRPLNPPAGGAASDSRATSDQGRRAREAFYSGDPRKALTLASASGERWIAGLAAYRLRSFGQAQQSFEALARDSREDAWLRAASGFWAARAAQALGDSAAVATNLALAAQAPHTFYGMIAQRQLQLQPPRLAEATGGQLIRASFNPRPANDVANFIASDIRAHRAAALAQIGRADEAEHELRAGLTQAATPAEQQAWAGLAASLAHLLARPAAMAAAIDTDDYPTPSLAPRFGFTIDKALVYAIVRQESRFNPMAVSHAGATGLMQLMPEAAARAAGDDKLKTDMTPLFDPAFNLRVGQDYVTWLMERGVGYDLLRVIAAYNGGPGMLQKTANLMGDDTDSLMVIESLPAAETRNYVEKVLAGYWTYRRMWGQEVATLDALATGARSVDARLDLADPRGAGPQLTAQPLQIGMR